MKVTQVMVELEKRVNDGNYGSEKATVQYVVQVDEGENPDEVVRQVISRARGRVIGELKASESATVRWALDPPQRLCGNCGNPLTDEERGYYCAACMKARKEERRQREDERRAAYSLAPAPDDDDEDEPAEVEGVPF